MTNHNTGCIFCHRMESPDCYICSDCVQKILAMSEDERVKAVTLAVEKGHSDQVKVLEGFKVVPKIDRKAL